MTHADDQRERGEFVPYADPYQEDSNDMIEHLKVRAEDLLAGDILGQRPTRRVVGAPVVAPIPTFTTDAAVVVRVQVEWPLAGDIETSQAFRSGQLVEIERTVA